MRSRCLRPVAIPILSLAVLIGTARAAEEQPAIYGGFETFDSSNGLLGDKVTAVLVQGDRVWCGGEKGLACREGGKWQTYGKAQGLVYPVVTSIAQNPDNGDVWVATLGGLSRFSGGTFENFTQLSSGLANDVVYSVAARGHDVWVATAAGLNHLDMRTRAFEIFNQVNTEMKEPWVYTTDIAGDEVWVAVWGAGVLEYETKTRSFRLHQDPDGELELDLLPNDGLLHNVVSWLDTEGSVTWVASYFGLSRYDGKEWQTFTTHDSGIKSDFIVHVKAVADGCWISTDRGVSFYDGRSWVGYERADDGRGLTTVTRDGKIVQQVTTADALAHSYAFGVDVAGDDVWIATARGLSHGRRLTPRSTADAFPAPAHQKSEPAQQEARR